MNPYNNQANNDLVFGFLLLLVFAALGCFLLTLTRKHYDTRYEQMKLFLIALAVRFAASIVVYEFGLVQVLGDEDSSGWTRGIYFMNQWVRDNIGITDLPAAMAQAYEGHHQGYYYLLAGLFYITDAPARMPAAALNNFLGAMTVVFVYRIAQSIFSNWSARYAAWIACFFPSLIIWSAQTVKEPVVIFLETVALYACIHLKSSGFKIRYVLLCAFTIAIMPPFRFYAAYLVGASILFSLILPQIKKAKSTYLSGIAVAAVAIPLVLGSGAIARNEAKFERFTQLKEIERFKYNVATGTGSGVSGNYDLNSSTGMAQALTVGAAHLMLAPFPWQLGSGSMRMLLSAPELFFWWWLVAVGLVPGMYYVFKNKFSEALPMLFFIGGMGLLYSMMFGNVGLVFRQRAQLMPWLLIIAVVGLEQKALKKILKTRESALLKRSMILEKGGVKIGGSHETAIQPRL